MKKLTEIAGLLLAVTSINASATLMSPTVVASEEEPLRLSLGVRGGGHNTTEGFGASNLDLGLGFTQNLAPDFEVGAAAAFGFFSDKQLFVSSERGFNLDVELMTRYLPEITDNIRLGAVFSVGYSRRLDDASKKAIYEKVFFGDMNFKLGPAMSLTLGEGSSFYLAPAITYSAVRFDIKDDDLKKKSNLLGLEIPVGVTFDVGGPSMFVQLNPIFQSLMSKDAPGMGFKGEMTAGFSFML